MRVSSIALPGFPEVEPGDRLGPLVVEALRGGDLEAAEGDILVVAQKIVSKAEGRIQVLEEVVPSACPRDG